MTDPDTSSAQDTEVIVAVEKRIPSFDLQVSVNRRKAHFLEL